MKASASGALTPCISADTNHSQATQNHCRWFGNRNEKAANLTARKQVRVNVQVRSATSRGCQQGCLSARGCAAISCDECRIVTCCESHIEGVRVCPTRNAQRKTDKR